MAPNRNSRYAHAEGDTTALQSPPRKVVILEPLLIAGAALVCVALLRSYMKRRSTEMIVTNQNFVEIGSMLELETFFDSTKHTRKMLYLHDPYCPMSGQAIREVAETRQPVAAVDVSRQRNISAAIEQITGIEHESPQILVIENGKAIWSASHNYITSLDISLALEADNEEMVATESTHP